MWLVESVWLLKTLSRILWRVMFSFVHNCLPGWPSYFKKKSLIRHTQSISELKMLIEQVSIWYDNSSLWGHIVEIKFEAPADYMQHRPDTENGIHVSCSPLAALSDVEDYLPHIGKSLLFLCLGQSQPITWRRSRESCNMMLSCHVIHDPKLSGEKERTRHVEVAFRGSLET